MAVDPRPDAKVVGVYEAGVDNVGAQRGIAVAALGARVGALVLRPVVVYSEVVCCGDSADVGPRIFWLNPMRGAPDDECDLAFEGQEFAPLGSFHIAPAGTHAARGFEEV